MTDKLTDVEIKKALECYRGQKMFAFNGKKPEIYIHDIIDLINRQEARIHQQEKTIMEIQNANLIDFKGTIANYKAENESLKAEVERLKTNLNVELDNFASEYDDKIKAEAYKNCVEKSEKAIFIKQDYRRKEMLEILKTYRGTRTYSDTEQATDNWLRGYGEAVQDVLGVFYNLLNELVGEDNSHNIDKQN